MDNHERALILTVSDPAQDFVITQKIIGDRIDCPAFYASYIIRLDCTAKLQAASSFGRIAPSLTGQTEHW